ncbi:MAG: putative Glutamyl endopeptidase [Promethearchaeota archaeon]|jgi:V8-like Glu-specific endopeptidase|nr:MAG: putative Glutamyl endopeptidase [Candidatus Lokiarchaeota archaeon]
MNFNLEKSHTILAIFLCSMFILPSLVIFSSINITDIALHKSEREENLINTIDMVPGLKAKELIEREQNFKEHKLFSSALDDPTIEWNPIEDFLDLENQKVESPSINPTKTVSLNLITGERDILEESSNLKYSGLNSMESYDSFSANDGSGGIIYSDDRQRINETEVFPWSAICKIYVTAANGSNFVGSGVIIDEYHVLTAGHVVYSHECGGWASSVKIVPGQDWFDSPFHHAYATNIRTYAGWTEDRMYQHDWAMLTLDRNIGSHTGWMNRRTADPSNLLYLENLNIAGYPVDLDSGFNMYWDEDIGDSADIYNHFYYMDTNGGMSGGPVWRYYNGQPEILTIHAYHQGDNHPNFGTRLNQDKYDRIFDWIAADTPPVDKPDFRDRGSSYSEVYGDNFQAGVSTISIDCDVENVGLAPDHTFVHFYASTDDFIGPGDYYLGNDYIQNIDPLSSSTANWNGLLPADIPEGYYYIGWIIDQGDYHAEHDESNNIGHHSQIVHIDGYSPPTSFIWVTARDDTNISHTLSDAYVIVEDESHTVIDTGYTDSEGHYNITGLEIGDYLITIVKEGYYTQTKSNYINYHDDDDYLVFNLQKKPYDSGYIEVTVKESSTSDPVDGAYVKCTNKSSGLLINTGYTDSNGFYNISGLTTGDWFEVEVSKLTYPSMTKSSHIEWNGDHKSLDFNLKQFAFDSGYIEVRAYNVSSGENLNGAMVECTNMTSGELIRTGSTDSEGFYNITNLTAGDAFQVNLSKTGEFYEQSQQSLINWNGDDDYLNFYLSEIPANAGYIEVNILDSNTRLPIGGALVECYYQSNDSLHSSGYTNINGEYRIENLEADWYEVKVSKVGYHSQIQSTSINWAGDDDYLTFDLLSLPPNSGYIEVTVNDLDTMAPVQSAEVICRSNDGTFFKSGYTDASGFYNLTGLSVGTWRVEIVKSGYEPTVKSQTINWNGDDDYLSFNLQSNPIDSGYIEIMVFDEFSEETLNGAFINCWNESSGILINTGNTDDLGIYKITGLYPGTMKIEVSLIDYRNVTKIVDLNWAGDHKSVEIYLQPIFYSVDGPIAIFRDQLPWGLNVTEPLLMKYNISYDVYNSSDFGTMDLSFYEKVIISSDQIANFYSELGIYRAWFENYVENGGLLEIHAVPAINDHAWETLIFPGNIEVTKLWADLNNISITQINHPMLHTPFLVEDDELDNWFPSTYGFFDTIPQNTVEILNTEGDGYPVMIEVDFGKGNIIATLQLIEYCNYYNRTRLLENMILYGGTDIISPSSNINYSTLLSPNFVTDTVAFSLSAYDDDYGVGVKNISYRINEGSWTSYTISFTLDGYTEGLYTIEYFATDFNGNEEIIKDEIIYLDNTAPLSNLHFEPISGNNIISENTTFTITSDDGIGSGVDKIHYRIDGGFWMNYSGNFNLSGFSPGEHIIEFYAVDFIGNSESIQTISINIPSDENILGIPLTLLMIFSAISIVIIVGKIRKNYEN